MQGAMFLRGKIHFSLSSSLIGVGKPTKQARKPMKPLSLMKSRWQLPWTCIIPACSRPKHHPSCLDLLCLWSYISSNIIYIPFLEDQPGSFHCVFRFAPNQTGKASQQAELQRQEEEAAGSARPSRVHPDGANGHKRTTTTKTAQVFCIDNSTIMIYHIPYIHTRTFQHLLLRTVPSRLTNLGLSE